MNETMTRSLSSTVYEAVQSLRPHPRIRPSTAPVPDTCARHTTVTEAVQYDLHSGATVDRPESLHLYSSQEQYTAATNRALGSLDMCDPRSPGSMSPASTLSAKSMLNRAKEVLSPRWRRSPVMPGEKGHGAFYGAKSVVKSFRRGSKGVDEEKTENSLSSVFHLNASGELDASIVDDIAPQITPLRPMSTFLPDLAILVPENEVRGSFLVQHDRIEDGDIGGEMVIRALCLPSSHATSATKGYSTTGTSFYTASETSYVYTPADKEDDDVFTNSNETSQTERPTTSFTEKLLDAQKLDERYKTLSVPSTTDSIMPLVDTPTPTPKLRRKVSKPAQGLQSNSLRSQFSKAEPAPPVLSTPKMWHLDRKESVRHLHVAPSLEIGLHADNLEVFEENAIADAAPIVHVEPDIIDVRRSETLKQLESRDWGISAQEQSAARNPTPTRQPNIGPAYDVFTMPPKILHTIVVSSAYGDVECTELASGFYNALIESRSSMMDYEWDGRKQRLLLQSHLVEKLKISMQYEFMRDDVYAVIRNQIFPTHNMVMQSNADFTAFVRRAVSEDKLAQERADEILKLAIREEDVGFMQTSPEEEVFFQREPFDSPRFVYDAGSSDGFYERLGSPASTVGTFEESEPEPEPRSNWRSSCLSKIALVFRFDRGKRI